MILDVDTADFTLVEASIKIEVRMALAEGSELTAAITSIDTLMVIINFKAPLPELDLSDLKIDPLKCNTDNDSWVLKVPPAKHPKVQTVFY